MLVDSVTGVGGDVGLEALGVGVEHGSNLGRDGHAVGASVGVGAGEDEVLGTGDDLDGLAEARGGHGRDADSEERAEGHGLLSLAGKVEGSLGVVGEVEEALLIGGDRTGREPSGGLVGEVVGEDVAGDRVSCGLEVAGEEGGVCAETLEDDGVVKLGGGSRDGLSLDGTVRVTDTDDLVPLLAADLGAVAEHLVDIGQDADLGRCLGNIETVVGRLRGAGSETVVAESGVAVAGGMADVRVVGRELCAEERSTTNLQLNDSQQTSSRPPLSSHNHKNNTHSEVPVGRVEADTVDEQLEGAVLLGTLDGRAEVARDVERAIVRLGTVLVGHGPVRLASDVREDLSCDICDAFNDDSPSVSVIRASPRSTPTFVQTHSSGSCRPARRQRIWCCCWLRAPRKSGARSERCADHKGQHPSRCSSGE